jgi:hypothetical protein
MGQRLEIELEVHQMIAISDGIIPPDAKLDSVLCIFYFAYFILFATSLVCAFCHKHPLLCAMPRR